MTSILHKVQSLPVSDQVQPIVKNTTFLRLKAAQLGNKQGKKNYQTISKRARESKKKVLSRNLINNSDITGSSDHKRYHNLVPMSEQERLLIKRANWPLKYKEFKNAKKMCSNSSKKEFEDSFCSLFISFFQW